MRKTFFVTIGLIFYATSFYCQSASGNALNYDGINDNVQTSGLIGISGPSDRTVEFLFNADILEPLPALPNVIIHWGYVGGSPPSRQSMFAVSSTYVQVDGGDDNYSPAYAFSINTWYHVAVTYSSGNINVYVNGQNIGTSTGHTWNTDNTVLSVVRGYFDWSLFDGNLDEVRIWNVVRSQAQIQTTLNDTLSSAYYSTIDSGLVAYYRFDEGTGGGNNSGVTTLTDLSPSSLNGTLNNFALSGSSSNWIVSDSPLPVELNNFTAQLNTQNIVLNWQTATEINNYGFEIQRDFVEQISNLSPEWEVIGFVEGHGNSNSPKDYSFNDKNPQGKNIKYRLKQIDTDGAFEYFPNAFGIEVEIALPTKFELLQNYPNPFNPSTTISYALPYESKVKVEIFNILGQRVDIVANRIESAGKYSTLWDASHLASGIYIIRINATSLSGNSNFTKSIKMQLLK